ncbi:hypothetical protein [Roseicitreum antarcticum]|uniref:Uncharacterized protein n=1 Tax=Roseicitreum antarcticum TaxID=564137 RepID=A0A1H2ZV84_9RHOB|nr:hypothetical protein [Roseicitreum antarcticum]SDX21323.1 hypothetical protein SAMN04488238_10688 [Roseicitreum antarcticum]
MTDTPKTGADTGLPAETLFEISDMLVLALDATARPQGYSQSEREARSYVRSALRRCEKLIGGAA